MSRPKAEGSARAERSIRDAILRIVEGMAATDVVRVVELPRCPLASGWDKARNNAQSDDRRMATGELPCVEGHDDEAKYHGRLQAILQTTASGVVYIVPTARQEQRADGTATMFLHPETGKARAWALRQTADDDGPDVLADLA